MSPQQETRGRNAQLERILLIIQDMTRLGGCDLYELADRYGTSVKTIRRDLEALQRAGLAIDREGEPDGRRLRWKLRLQGSRLARATTGLDAGHYLALRIVMAEAASVARTSGLYAALEDLLARIEAAVGPKGRPRLAAIEAAFLSWGKHGYARDARDLVWPLTEAVARRRICLVRYRALGADQVREHEVLPLKLVVHDRTIYLVCRFEHRQAIGFLHLHRVEGVTVTSREATPPPDFDEATFADSAFEIVPGDEVVTYRLRFSAAVRPYITERIWHPGQVLTPLVDGGVELTFTCGETHEVTRWVASWLTDVTVIGPESLRCELAHLGQACAARYGTTGT